MRRSRVGQVVWWGLKQVANGSRDVWVGWEKTGALWYIQWKVLLEAPMSSKVRQDDVCLQIRFAVKPKCGSDSKMAAS